MLLASRQKLSSRDVCLECACEGVFFEGARAGEEKQKHTILNVCIQELLAFPQHFTPSSFNSTAGYSC